MTLEIDICDMVGAYAICNQCASHEVLRDASASWDLATGEWQLEMLFDAFVCDNCGEECVPIWRIDEEFRRKEIARLNDGIRRGEGNKFTIVATSGVQALGRAAVGEISQRVAEYDDFSGDSDPHEEHDFGCIEVGGEKIFWKIDLLDLNLKQYSPDPANAQLTHRVLTIMLASEY